MALPRNLIQFKTNIDERYQHLVEFAVKAKLLAMARNGVTDLLFLKQELESILNQHGQLFGIPSGRVQTFGTFSDINLEEECRGFIECQRNYWYGKFRDERIHLYIFILGH